MPCAPNFTGLEGMMSETIKWKFNFSLWPSIQVIILPWAHMEREMKSSWGRGRRGAAGSVPETCVSWTTAPPTQTHFGTDFSRSQILEEVVFKLFL